MVLSTRRPQASFLKTMIGVEASSVLGTIFLSANRSRSWNFCITLVLQGLAFLHDQQEVVDREPPVGPVPLRGLVMPLPLAVIPHFFPLASDCSAQPRLGPFPLSFPAADWWGPPNGGWSIFNTCANHRFHQSLSVSRQPRSALHLVWLLGHDHLNLNDH